MPTYTSTDSQRILEPGDYHATIQQYEWKYAKNSGNSMLQLKLRTDDGAVLFDNLVFTEKAFWKIDEAMRAFLPSKGKKPPKVGDEVDINDQFVNDNLLGATGWIQVEKGTTPSGRARNEIKRYISPEEKGEQPAEATTTKPPPAATPTSAMPAKQKAKKKIEDDDEIPF